MSHSPHSLSYIEGLVSGYQSRDDLTEHEKLMRLEQAVREEKRHSDPDCLVGKKVRVEWSGDEYEGTITDMRNRGHPDMGTVYILEHGDDGTLPVIRSEVVEVLE